jgi:hypothetical protein
MAEDFEDSQARIAAAAARSAEFQNMVRDWNMRNQVAFLPGILGQGKATADFYTNQPRTMFVSDRFQPQNVQEYQGGDVADIIPWTGLPEEVPPPVPPPVADPTIAPTDPVFFDQSTRLDGGNDFFIDRSDFVPIETFDFLQPDFMPFDPRIEIGQFFRGLDLNPTIDIDFLTEAVANSTGGMGGPDDWMYWANEIMGQGLYEGDAARSFTGPIGDYATDQGDESRLYTGPIITGDQGLRPDQFTGAPIVTGDQGLRPDQFTGAPIVTGDQGLRPDQFTGGPIVTGDQGLRPDQFTGAPIVTGDQGLRPDQFTGAPIVTGDQGLRPDQFTGAPIVTGDQGLRPDQFTGAPIVTGDQGLRPDQFTGAPIVSGDQGLRPDQFTGAPIVTGDQGLRPDQFIGAPIVSGDQGLRPDQFTGAPIVSEDQGLRPDQFTNAPIRGDNPILDDLGLRGLLIQGPLADFGVPNLEDLTTQYTGDYTPPVSLARFDEASLNEFTRQIGGPEASVPEESPIERILMDVRNNTIPVEDAVTELVEIGLPEDAAVNIIISHTEDFTSGLTSGIPGVIG